MRRWNAEGLRRERRTRSREGEQDHQLDLATSSPNKAWGVFYYFSYNLCFALVIFIIIFEQFGRANYKLRFGFSLLVLSRAVKSNQP